MPGPQTPLITGWGLKIYEKKYVVSFNYFIPQSFGLYGNKQYVKNDSNL